MSVCRGLVTFFNGSTQAVGKLKGAQTCGILTVYKLQVTAVTVINGVQTRWWSDWRMLRRMRWLRPAIQMLHSSGEIECVMLSNNQWTLLHQIEVALTTMANFQRILEVEDEVTGSLVCLAVYRIRAAYVAVYNSEHTEESVKSLTATLLADFDQRYHPADDSGKVTYTGAPNVGFRNRYTGVHPYLMVASVLDPRVKGLLHGDKSDLDYIMTESHFEDLLDDVVDHMIAQVHENGANDDGDDAEKGIVLLE